ncbi:MAG: hypothetical protein JWP88_2315 [Flaviaesturariibacter sp.]|nr:hypothetical protein [Flaviaesturariibacter sp.]
MNRPALKERKLKKFKDEITYSENCIKNEG